MKKIIHLITKPFKRLRINLKDIKTLVIFIIVFLVLSSEVWVFYLLGFIFSDTDFGKRCLGIGSACWLFWLGPFTPFLPLCIAITFGIKALFNKIRFRKIKSPKIIYFNSIDLFKIIEYYYLCS